MYQPPHFREDRIEVQHALIRAHPLGLLITAGPAGLLANLFPFLLDGGGGEKGTVRVQNARAHSHWRGSRVMNDAAWLRRQIEDLTRSRETPRNEPWLVSDAPEDFVAMQMRAI